jgi:hypothetical protein
VGREPLNRADHAAYISAITEGLQSRELRIIEATVTTAENGCREAMLLLRAEADAFAVEAPARLAARWDEERGWRLEFGDTPTACNSFWEGTEILPNPQAVAAWVVVALTYPALAAAQEPVRFREHSNADPSFEARLAKYAVGS